MENFCTSMDTIKEVKDNPWENIIENGSDKYPEYIKKSYNLKFNSNKKKNNPALKWSKNSHGCLP